MGNFSSRQNKVDNARERDNQRRDRLAGYFYDLSKLSFAGLVIGVITQLFTDGGGEANLSVIITGLVLRLIFSIGVIVVGGIYLWTCTKRGKKWLENL